MATKSLFVRGVFWNFLEKVVVKSSSFVIGIVLARILSPGDYGLMGMLAVFTALSNIIIEGGFVKALVQKKNCCEVDYSTAFFTNLGVSLILYLVLFFSAPLISRFYNEPKLVEILRVLSINFVIGSLNVVQRAQLTRNMDFKSMAQINFFGVIAGGIAGIVMAYTGFGVWALVGQTIAHTLVMSIMFPLFSKWRPKAIFSRDSFKQLFGFGSKLMATGVVATIVNNISTIAIGKVYKSDQLGYYTRATQFSELVALTIYDVIGAVSFPALSSLQDERQRMVALYKKTLLFVAMTVFPVMILMALLAKPLVVILLTEKWLPCVLMLQVLCFARMLTPLSAVNMNILNAIGRSDLFMKIDFIKTPMAIIALAITIPIGVEAVVWGNLATTVISFFVNTYYPKKIFGYGALEQIKDYKYIIISLILMSGAVLLFVGFVSNPWIQLLCGCLIGAAVYISACFAFKVIDVGMIKNLLKRA